MSKHINILLIGYGSIGRRHAANLISMGIKPYVLTRHPDKLGAHFLSDIKNCNAGGFDACIISSPTAAHLSDFRKCLRYSEGIKRVFIEKPLEASSGKAEEIIKLSQGLNVYVAYNLRFLRAFDLISDFIKKNKKSIRIVEAIAGHDLRQWRAGRNLSESYSAQRRKGGGVDLDLSHEVDYILWLFGAKFKDKFICRNKISNLEINSPDICKLVLGYKNFLVDITLDYIRPQKERYLKISCDNANALFYNFVTGVLSINNKIVFRKNEIDESYRRMLKAFLGIDKSMKNKLCSLDAAKAVLEVLEV